MKAFYVEYSDSSFSTEKSIPPEWRHKGILGPILRGTVGETLEIHFLNRLNFSCNIIPRLGIDLLDQANSSIHFNGIAPGNSHISRWYLGSSSEPIDSSSTFFLYHSTVHLQRHIYSGLLGIIIVDKNNSTYVNSAGVIHPTGIDSELVMVLSAISETSVVPELYNYNVERTFPGTSNAFRNALRASRANSYQAINGFIFGGQTDTEFDFITFEGTTARWYIFVAGGSFDIHTAHFHAQTGVWRNKRTGNN